MKLEDLLAGEKVLACHADPGTEITGISWDTRNLNAGELYFALPGYKTDGQRYAERAAEQGAGAVVCAQAPPCPGPWVVAADPRALLAAVSRRRKFATALMSSLYSTRISSLTTTIWLVTQPMLKEHNCGKAA